MADSKNVKLRYEVAGAGTTETVTTANWDMNPEMTNESLAGVMFDVVSSMGRQDADYALITEKSIYTPDEISGD